MKKLATLVAGVLLVSGMAFAADATTSSGVVTNAKAKVEWKASVMKISGATYELNSTKTTETAITSMIGIDDKNLGAYEPSTNVEISATLFNAVDAKLTVKGNKDADATQLSLAKTWDGNTVEFTSDINLAAADLFPAIFGTSNIKVKKVMKETEGQVKFSKQASGKLAIDTTSSDTYAKWTPGAGALSLTFRPYDIDWKIGSEFENKTFNTVYTTTINGVTYGTDIYIPGLEAEYKLSDSLKLVGAINSNLSTASEDKIAKTKSNASMLVTKVGGEIVPAKDSKVNANVILFTAGTKNENNGTTTTDDSSFQLHLSTIAEAKMGDLKVNGELAFITGNDEKKISKVKDGFSLMMLFAKGALTMGDLTPYLSGKVMTTGLSSETNGTKTLDGASNTVELKVGADKKVESLTLNGELAFAVGGTEEKQSKYKAGTNGITIGTKVTYEF